MAERTKPRGMNAHKRKSSRMPPTRSLTAPHAGWPTRVNARNCSVAARAARSASAGNRAIRRGKPVAVLAAGPTPQLCSMAAQWVKTDEHSSSGWAALIMHDDCTKPASQ
eukprot:7051900-Lingulodinium_polyedra.AAC.1